MKFRPHRGMLADAMKECIEFNGRQALIDHLRAIHPMFGPSFIDDVEIKPYSERPDTRIGWKRTCIVESKQWGPIGFTDGIPE